MHVGYGDGRDRLWLLWAQPGPRRPRDTVVPPRVAVRPGPGANAADALIPAMAESTNAIMEGRLPLADAGAGLDVLTLRHAELGGSWRAIQLQMEGN